MIVVAILVAAAILVSNIMMFSSYVDSNIKAEMLKISTSMFDEIEMMKSKARIASLFFANDSAISRAMENGNRRDLLNRTIELYNETRVELCVITDTAGRVLAEPYPPNAYGTDISLLQSIREALSGEPFTTIEYGLIADMVACTSSPVKNEEGTLLGIIAVGYRLDTEKFVDTHKMTDKYEITIYRGDTRIATTLFNENGTRATGTKAPEAVSQTVLAGKVYSDPLRVFNIDMMTLYTPINNAEDAVIGMLFVGYHLSDKVNTVLSFITSGFLITVFLLGTSILVIFLVVRYVSTPIDKMLDKIHYDSLTEIYNRRFFDESIERLIKSMTRTNGMLSLMMIDIDFFKNYNDTYGHSKGDDCLKIVAKTLSQCVTRPDDFVSRFGGEEFVVVMPNTDASGAQSVARKMLKGIQDCGIPHEKSDAADCITVSIGVTTGNVKHTQNGDDYVKQADKMLYKSKQEGRNRFNFAAL